MGFGLSVWFPVDPGNGTGREFYQEYFLQLLSPVPEWLPGRMVHENGFQIKLVPFEEDIHGTWENGRLCVSARTNSAGPGYHAYLVEVLDGLGIAPLEVEDETGYYESRDFGLLRSAITQWLQGVSAKVLELSVSGQYSNIAISLSTDTVPENTGHLACCQIGYCEREFFDRAHRGEPLGADFFVWWNNGRDALFFKNAALHLLWCEFNWLPPVTDRERETCAAVLACLTRAQALQPGLELPGAAWLEVARLAGEEALAQTLRSRYGDTDKVRIGYNQGLISHSIRGWRATFSGMMHSDMAQEGPVWWDDTRTIRTRTMEVEWKEGASPDSAALLRDAVGDADCEPFPLRCGEITACIQHTLIEEESVPLHLTRLTAAQDNELLFLFLFYTNPADRDWATDVCRSVTR